MELSTTIPNTTIKAANVTLVSGIPNRYIKPIEINIVNGMVVAETTAERIGNRSIITNITMTIAIAKSPKKEVPTHGLL